MYTLTDTAKATILLCSHLALTDRRYKPFTPLAWNKLGQILVASDVKEPGHLLGMCAQDISDALKLRKEEAERIEVLLARGVNVAMALDELAKRSIFVVTKSDAAYPVHLKKNLPSNKIPPVLFYCGDLSLAGSDGIAIVGSRDLDYEGEQETKKLATEAARQDLTVYSGGAKGVDSIAAQAALAAGGKTVGFLANSLSQRIRNKQVRESIQTGHMLLLSAVLPSMGFTVGNAMGRNKYVYALSKAAFVIASSAGHGGTWEGAMESLKEGYAPVYVWETDRYPGNRALIEKGAHPFDGAIDWQVVKQETAPDRRQPEPFMDSLFSASSVASVEPASVEHVPSVVATAETVSEHPSTAYGPHKAETEQDLPEPTIFQAVWPLLRRALLENDSEEALTNRLGNDIVKKQLHIWLKIAIEKKLVTRKTHPVRYELNQEPS